jgi:hypothetical protein
MAPHTYAFRYIHTDVSRPMERDHGKFIFHVFLFSLVHGCGNDEFFVNNRWSIHMITNTSMSLLNVIAAFTTKSLTFS